MKSQKIDSVIRAVIFKKLVVICKKAHFCCYCNAVNGNVKKVSGACMKVVHETKAKDDEDVIAAILKSNPDLVECTSLKPNKFQEVLNPLKVFDLFSRITDEDAELLWMRSSFSRPESLIIWTVPVSPVPIRPSVASNFGGGGSTEDDLTIKLQEILVVNNALKTALEKGAVMKTVAEDWEFLQVFSNFTSTADSTFQHANTS